MSNRQGVEDQIADLAVQIAKLRADKKRLRADNKQLRGMLKARNAPAPCPDCGGTGIVAEPRVDPESRDVTVIGMLCETCSGMGRIEVP